MAKNPIKLHDLLIKKTKTQAQKQDKEALAQKQDTASPADPSIEFDEAEISSSSLPNLAEAESLLAQLTDASAPDYKPPTMLELHRARTQVEIAKLAKTDKDAALQMMSQNMDTSL